MVALQAERRELKAKIEAPQTNGESLSELQARLREVDGNLEALKGARPKNSLPTGRARKWTSSASGWSQGPVDGISASSEKGKGRGKGFGKGPMRSATETLARSDAESREFVESAIPSWETGLPIHPLNPNTSGLPKPIPGEHVVLPPHALEIGAPFHRDEIVTNPDSVRSDDVNSVASWNTHISTFEVVQTPSVKSGESFHTIPPDEYSI